MEVHSYLKYALKMIPKKYQKLWKEIDIFFKDSIPYEIDYTYKDPVLNDVNDVRSGVVPHKKTFIHKNKLAVEMKYRTGEYVIVKKRNQKSCYYEIHEVEEEKPKTPGSLFDEILADSRYPSESPTVPDTVPDETESQQSSTE